MPDDLRPEPTLETMKRSRYVHTARKDGLWIIFNLMSQQEIFADDSSITAYHDLLSDPNSTLLANSLSAQRQELIEKKFLIPAKFDEVYALSQSFKRKKNSDGHLGLGIVLTHDCNFRCGYCYQRHEDINLSSDDISRIKTFFTSQLDSRTVNRVRLTWWGGEPLMKRAAIFELSEFFISECDKRDILYTAYTSTNGSLLTYDVAQRLKACKLNSYHITIDGPQKWHDIQRPNRGGGGTYKKVLRALDSIQKAYGSQRKFCVLRVNLSEEMSRDLPDWYQLIEDLKPFSNIIKVNLAFIEESELGDVKEWSVEEYSKKREAIYSLFIESGFEIQNYDLNSGGFRKPGGLFCGAIHKNNWMIMPDGRVSKCVVELHKPSHDSAKLSVEGSLEMTEFGQKWDQYDPTENPICSTCDVLPVCMGGCKMLPLFDQNGSRCAIKQTMQENLMSRMEKMIIEAREEKVS